MASLKEEEATGGDNAVGRQSHSNESSSSSSSSDNEGEGPPAPPLPEGADREVIELEIEDNSDEEEIFRQLIAAATRRGVPLNFLAALGGGPPGIYDEDDEDIEYPFDPPTSLKDVAEFMKSDKCRKILILSGAGMSVASGIPDFRSRDGFYATLNADSLSCTSPEQVEQIRNDPCYCLDQQLFLENPLPCLEVNREFILGTQAEKWKPTLAHRILTMATAGKLCRWYTQNIDGLEDACCHGGGSVPQLSLDQIIAVHGSMDRATCAVCREEMEFDEFCQKVKTQIKDISGQDSDAPATSTPIVCNSCGAPSVKPDIVLFHSSLPEKFFQNVPNDVQDVDLLLIVGTSLHVAPANSVVWRVPKTCMRVLINRERVGWHLGLDLNSDGGSSRDYFAQGNCEDTALDLLEQLDRLSDINAYLDCLPEASTILARERLAKPAHAAVATASTTEVAPSKGGLSPSHTDEQRKEEQPQEMEA